MRDSFFHYCPSCGSERIRFDKRFHCPDCDFIYFHNNAAAVGAILTCGGEVMFVERAQEPAKGKLGLPGGFVDADETAEEALTREVREEIGLEISNWTYLCSEPNDYLYKDIPYKTTDIFFTAELPEKPALTVDADEISGVRWIAKSDIKPTDIAFKSMRNVVARL